MTSLHYGLTPKMKPLSPRRSALVVALDIGTSKIACLDRAARRPIRRAMRCAAAATPLK